MVIALESLKAKDYEGDQFYAEHSAAGLDYLICGEWHFAYARMVAAATLQRTYSEPRMFEGGCACGALLNAFKQSGTFSRVFGMDLSSSMVNKGREAFGFSENEIRYR